MVDLLLVLTFVYSQMSIYQPQLVYHQTLPDELYDEREREQSDGEMISIHLQQVTQNNIVVSSTYHLFVGERSRWNHQSR